LKVFSGFMGIAVCQVPDIILLFFNSSLPGYASVLFGTGFGYDAANIWGTPIKCLISSWLFRHFQAFEMGLQFKPLSNVY